MCPYYFFPVLSIVLSFPRSYLKNAFMPSVLTLTCILDVGLPSRLAKIASRGDLHCLQLLKLLVVGTKRMNNKQCSSILKRWSCTLSGSGEKEKSFEQVQAYYVSKTVDDLNDERCKQNSLCLLQLRFLSECGQQTRTEL